MACADVMAAALSDGLHHRFDCFPDSEKPRWLMALVVAPGYDYHWYRKQKKGFWGHKPGGTAARNVDNDGAIVWNPEKVELDAFSGRPNPRWELTRAETAEFLMLLRALPRAHGSYSTGGGLGYRGFIVRANDGPVDGYDDIRLYRGTVLARHGDQMHKFSDPQRVLEHWLLRSAGGHLAEPVRQYIQSEIER